MCEVSSYKRSTELMTIHMIQYMILNIKIYFFSVSRKLIYLKENVFYYYYIIITYYYNLLSAIT